MQYLVMLMPLFAALPVAAAAVWIVHGILRHRERMSLGNAEIERLREELEALRASHLELQERVDFTERALAQVRGAQRDARALE